MNSPPPDPCASSFPLILMEKFIQNITTMSTSSTRPPSSTSVPHITGEQALPSSIAPIQTPAAPPGWSRMQRVDWFGSWWDLFDEGGCKQFDIWAEESNAWFWRWNGPIPTIDFAVLQVDPEHTTDVSFHWRKGGDNFKRVGYMWSFLFLLNKKLYDPCPP